MAYRMQTTVPEVIDMSGESEETFKLYGPDSKTPGTFASELPARAPARRARRARSSSSSTRAGISTAMSSA